MDKETNYFYSELEDNIIVNSIQAEFKKRQEERKPFELSWELNMNFYLGNQYSYISNSGEILDIERNYPWENREVYNHIAPIIESRLSKLNKIEPVFDISSISSREEDINSARLSKTILKDCLNKNNFKNVLSTVTHWSEITGTAFYKITWDSEQGNYIGKIDEKIINSGDVKISACSPFEIYPDSNNICDIEECQSIIYAKAQPVKVINELYNTDIDGDDIDTFELNNHSYISSISGRSNITKITHSVKSNYAYLIERYEKPNKEHPNGKLTIICKDKLLFDGELPYKNGKDNSLNYPFIKQISNKQLSCFWGTSVIERCIPIQRAYNALKNKKHEYISRLASGILTVEDGSVDIDNLEDEGLAPGKILVYRNGSTPPKFMSPGTIPSELEKEEESLLNELNSLSCISDISTSSNIPSNISSGSAISLLIEQDEARLSLTAEHIRNSLVLVANSVLRLFKQYATTPRLTKYFDSNGLIQIFCWSNKDIVDENISLIDDNELQNDFVEKQDTIFALYDKGLFFNNNGKLSLETKKKLFEMVGINSFDFEEELEDIHKSRAKQENVDALNLEAPLEIDDHKIHIEEHTRYLLTNNLEPAQKNNILNHIKKHKQYLTQ